MKIEVPGNDIMGGIFYDDNGVEIGGVRRVDISMEVGEFNTANIELVCVGPIELEVEGKCLVYHPETRKLAEVASIKFKDGTVWDPLAGVVEPGVCRHPSGYSQYDDPQGYTPFSHRMICSECGEAAVCDCRYIESRYEAVNGVMSCVSAKCYHCGDDVARSIIPAAGFSATDAFVDRMQFFKNAFMPMPHLPVVDMRLDTA